MYRARQTLDEHFHTRLHTVLERHGYPLTMLDSMRKEDESPAIPDAVVAAALEHAAEPCERGELWLDVALAMPDADRREDFLKMAQTALNRAGQSCTEGMAQDYRADAYYCAAAHLAISDAVSSLLICRHHQRW